jgi:hypothetical protein
MKRKGADALIRYGNRSAHRKNDALAHRLQNAARDHSGSRALSQAGASFFVRHSGVLRIVSYANERVGSGVA